MIVFGLSITDELLFLCIIVIIIVYYISINKNELMSSNETNSIDVKPPNALSTPPIDTQPPIHAPITSSEDTKPSTILHTTQEETKKPQCYVLGETKTQYNKYDSIELPSNISNPYISRDYVCFRNMIGDTKFTQMRPHCMACSVDKRNNQKTYDNTNTNIISTCSYTDDSLVNSSDPSLWNKQQCLQACAEIKDMV